MRENVWMDEDITLEQLEQLFREDGAKVTLGEGRQTRIEACRTYLDGLAQQHERVMYGINTGFGALHSTVIPQEQLEQLQKNLVLSHACGAGEEVPREIVSLMLLLKARGLSYGHSGVQMKTVERLLDMYHEGITPVVFEKGSLGASGDLAPLAHMSLPLIGEGEVDWNGERMTGHQMLERKGWDAITLRSKEGLALLNGTQFMSAHGVWAIWEANRMWKMANLIGAMSLEAFDGRPEPFGVEVNHVRRQEGQIQTAAEFRDILTGSDLVQREKVHVQDPYCLRCIPQVHGASKDVFDHVATILEREVNAVTDNPTVFADLDMVVSAGNFHGQPLALSMDMLAIALAELGSISERRSYKLLSGERGLPAFLVARPGLNSGFMIPQYTAASIVSANKQLCTPASVDTIDSSNGQEDHVSMGANAATKLRRVVENTWQVLGIELMVAAQGLDLRRPGKSSEVLEELHAAYRKHVPFMEQDRYLHPDIVASVDFVKNYSKK